MSNILYNNSTENHFGNLLKSVDSSECHMNNYMADFGKVSVSDSDNGIEKFGFPDNLEKTKAVFGELRDMLFDEFKKYDYNLARPDYNVWSANVMKAFNFSDSSRHLDAFHVRIFADNPLTPFIYTSYWDKGREYATHKISLAPFHDLSEIVSYISNQTRKYESEYIQRKRQEEIERKERIEQEKAAEKAEYERKKSQPNLSDMPPEQFWREFKSAVDKDSRVRTSDLDKYGFSANRAENKDDMLNSIGVSFNAENTSLLCIGVVTHPDGRFGGEDFEVYYEDIVDYTSIAKLANVFCGYVDALGYDDDDDDYDDDDIDNSRRIIRNSRARTVNAKTLIRDAVNALNKSMTCNARNGVAFTVNMDRADNLLRQAQDELRSGSNKTVSNMRKAVSILQKTVNRLRTANYMADFPKISVPNTHTHIRKPSNLSG